MAWPLVKKLWPLEARAGAARKTIPGAGAGAAWGKNQELEPLEKKNKEPEPQKNLPAPQPCVFFILFL